MPALIFTATAAATNLDINEPILPCRRKAPHCIDDGSSPKTVEDHYRVIYFEALDLIISCIENRFEQPGYKTYGKVLQLQSHYDKELQFVLSFYGSDFDSQTIKSRGKVTAALVNVT